jgi:hypothetical protein
MQRDARRVGRPRTEEMACGEEGKHEAGRRDPPGGKPAARFLLQALGQALPGQFFLLETLFGERVGRRQPSPPGQKFIGSFV